jgi:hypothetical protein
MKKIFYFVGGLLFLIASYSFFLIISPTEAIRLTREDALIETIGVIFLLLASVITFYIFLKSKSPEKPYFLKTKRNIFYLLLSLFLFVCLCEEISWGQRIFQIDTPEFLMETNKQKELNVHNLEIFEPYDNDLTPKSGFNKLITSEKLFAYFWLFYCVLVPIGNEFSSWIRNIFRKFHFPVMPLWLGILFLLNHVISKVFEGMDQVRNHLLTGAIMEIKETIFQVLFLIVGISLYYLYELLQKKMQAK